MHVTAHLDVDAIAVETETEVSVLLELTAPTADPDEQRPQRTLQVVVDRSGSMAGRIEGARTALAAIVDRLEPGDNFGVVAFDDRVELTVPAGPLSDKAAAKRAIAGLAARGNTNLSDGYLRGIQEARRVAGPAGAALLLVSDGHANAGIVDHDALGGLAADAYRNGVVTSTLGWGLGYDERLLAAIARGGTGNEGFAETSDAAVQYIAGEVTGLLSQTAQGASLHITPYPPVTAVRVLNELTTTATADGIIAELGTFYSGQTRKLVVTFTVPSVPALGLARVATLSLTYVELPALKQHTVDLPIHVNVVPGDEAAGRVPDPVVRTEVVFQQVQRAKRAASDSLVGGRYDEAQREIAQAQALVQGSLGADTPQQLRADLEQEARELRDIDRQIRQGQYSGSSKYLSSSASMKSRSRGSRSYDYNRPRHEDPHEDPGQSQ